MHIINGNNEVFEIKDPSLVRRFTNLRPDGEPLVIDGFENGIRLEDVVEACVYDGKLEISKSEDNLDDLEIEIRREHSTVELEISIKKQIDQVSIFICWEEATALPECIWYMKNLSELRFFSMGITSLPESIGNLRSLNSLNLSGTNLTELPESIGNLRSLSSLNLSGTNLTELPESIGNLSSLSSLSLRFTRLTELPESIGNLSSLSSLDGRFFGIGLKYNGSLYWETGESTEYLSTLDITPANQDDNAEGYINSSGNMNVGMLVKHPFICEWDYD